MPDDFRRPDLRGVRGKLIHVMADCTEHSGTTDGDTTDGDTTDGDTTGSDTATGSPRVPVRS